MLKLPTLIFRKNQKPLQIKKKQLNKPSEHMWRYLKVVPGTFRDVAQKQKTNLDFQRIFDNPPGKYLFFKEFLEGIGYISSYLTVRVSIVD